MAEADPAPSPGGEPAQQRALRARGRRTIRRLTEAGREVFAARGYHAARVDDVVKRADTSHGTFYLYFSGKEDLLAALVRDLSADLLELAERLPPIDPGQEGRTALRTWLAEFGAHYDRQGSVLRAWTEAQGHSADLSTKGAEVLGGFIDALAVRIAEATVDGDIDANVAALAFVAMIERVSYFGGSFPTDDVSLDTFAAIIHKGMFGGARERRVRGWRAS